MFIDGEHDQENLSRDEWVSTALVGMRTSCDWRDFDTYVAHLHDLLQTPGDGEYPSFQVQMSARAFRAGLSTHDVEDLVADANARVFAAATKTFRSQDGSAGGHFDIVGTLGRTSPAGAMGGYLSTIVSNLCIDKHRTDARTIVVDFAEEPAYAGEGLPDLELTAAVRAALGQLDPQQAEVVTLVDCLDQTVTEVARYLGTSRGTVYNRLHAGRARLHALLEDHA